METKPTCEWFCAGEKIFPAMLDAIDAAQKSVAFEIYIYENCALGKKFLDAFVRAAHRGANVRVLVDAIGSLKLPRNFWDPLRAAGGKVLEFNPVTLQRGWIRNHRKLLVCDEKVAFLGGFNIAPEYDGDGVKTGWCDVGMKIEGALVSQLIESFDEMFSHADFRHKHFVRLHKSVLKKSVKLPKEQILFSGPGRGRNPFLSVLRRDLSRAKTVRIVVAYFLPTWRLRRELLRVVKRGGKVQLILAGKSDVPLSMLAGQSLYRRFLNGQIEIYEYQPQILHAKMLIVDNAVFIGSSNLDARSFHINYEMMIRFDNREVADAANKIFETQLENSRRITAEEWHKSRTFFGRWKQRWAYFLLNRLDPYLARLQWRVLSN